MCPVVFVFSPAQHSRHYGQQPDQSRSEGAALTGPAAYRPLAGSKECFLGGGGGENVQDDEKKGAFFFVFGWEESLILNRRQ